jgi:hypothetical protein
VLYLEGLCTHCEAGQLGFRRCSDGKTIVLMCDECDFVWFDPARRTLEDSVFPDMSTFQVPGSPCSIGGGAAGWATRAEVERAGWQAFIAGERSAPG